MDRAFGLMMQYTKPYTPPRVSGIAAITYAVGYQNFIVPENVYLMHVDLVGAAGGFTNHSASKGGRVQFNMAVTPGETLRLLMGEKGKDGRTAGTAQGGGAAAGAGAVDESGVSGSGGGGGGGSSIWREDALLAVAGGAGAKSYAVDPSSNGGGLVGQSAASGGAGWAQGGNQSSGGAGGYNTLGSTGGAGSYLLGGTGGPSNSTYPNYPGGGGGGGYYGGGGGGSAHFGGTFYANAGGGSSGTPGPGITDVEHTQGFRDGLSFTVPSNGNGYCIFSWGNGASYIDETYYPNATITADYGTVVPSGSFNSVLSDNSDATYVLSVLTPQGCSYSEPQPDTFTGPQCVLRMPSISGSERIESYFINLRGYRDAYVGGIAYTYLAGENNGPIPFSVALPYESFPTSIGDVEVGPFIRTDGGFFTSADLSERRLYIVCNGGQYPVTVTQASLRLHRITN